MTDEDEVRQVEGCWGGGGRGDNGRDRQVGVGWGRGGEREERHGSQSAHTVKAGRSVPCPSETLAQSPELLCTWKGGETFKCLFVLISLPRLTPSHSSPRPLHPQHRVLIYKNKTKKAEQQCESHSELHRYVELE